MATLKLRDDGYRLVNASIYYGKLPMHLAHYSSREGRRMRLLTNPKRRPVVNGKVMPR